jgi:hypothetical protein
MARSLLMKRGVMLALALAPLLAAIGSAAAQDGSTGERRANGPAAAACRPDVQKLCAGIKPGGGRIVACLHEHEADVSPTCQDAMAAAKAARESAQQPK